MIDRRRRALLRSSPAPSRRRLRPDAASHNRPAMSRITAYAFSFAGLDGGDIRLADYAGKPILIVNTASLCGYTPQFTGLQQLWARYHDARPDDRRRAVERFRRPGAGHAGRDHAHRARANMASAFRSPPRPRCKGANPHPFYKWAATERPLETPRWNFHKYLDRPRRPHRRRVPDRRSSRWTRA